MTLELEDTEESGEKLGAINATFTIEPKNVEDRQEVSNVHSGCLLSLDACGKLAEHRKSISVARGESKCYSSFLSALPT